MTVMVVVFTTVYPYMEWEASFLRYELEILQKHYHRVVLVPCNRYGNTELYPTPFEVDTTLSALILKESTSLYWRIFKEIRIFADPLLYKEIIYRPDILLNWKLMKILRHSVFVSQITEKWLRQKHSVGFFDCEATVLYTVWCTPFTLGAGRFSKVLDFFVVISRALGHEIMEERNPGYYVPLHPWILQYVNYLFPCSKASSAYLSSRYPECKSKITTARLGTPKQSVCTPMSTDGKIRLVSCSRISPEKRVDLIFEGIYHFSRKYSTYAVEWTHIGPHTGPYIGSESLIGRIETLIQEKQLSNLQVHLLGHIPSVYDYYTSHVVDVFLNMSSSEGLPVTIMEAESFGIPVIATAVGGNSEIVDDTCGKLISADPTPEEIANSIHEVMYPPVHHTSLRQGAREMWEMGFDQSKNTQDFISQLDQILKHGKMVTEPRTQTKL